MNFSNDLNALRSAAEDIARRAHELFQSWGSSDNCMPPTDDLSSLYLAHYTSLEAVVSMLQSQDGGLRLSDTSIMNDPYEGRATTEGRSISRLLEDEFGKDSWLWRRYSAANVCSFVGVVKAKEKNIDAGDNLLFWRLYGNDCRGISITIPPHASENLVKSSIINPIVYTDKPSIRIEVTSISSLLKDLDDLRCRARDVDLWSQICPIVLSACDQLFKQLFLIKHSHYDIEREYRAIAFLSGDDSEDSHYQLRGKHVKYGLVRRYVQIPELSCNNIFTTGSQITIGSNVLEKRKANSDLSDLLEEADRAPNVVSVRVSEIEYRPR